MEGGQRFRARNQTAMSHHLAYPLAVERAMENPNYATVGSGYHPKSQHSQASKLGRKHMMPMEGAGWWDYFKQGFRSVGDVALHPLLSVLPYGNVASAGLRAVGLGKAKAGGKARAGAKKSCGGSDGRMSRASIVAKVMREQGLPLGKASKYVKDNKLY